MFFLIHIYIVSLVAVDMKKYERAKQKKTVTKDKHKATQEEVSFPV